MIYLTGPRGAHKNELLYYIESKKFKKLNPISVYNPVKIITTKQDTTTKTYSNIVTNEEFDSQHDKYLVSNTYNHPYQGVIKYGILESDNVNPLNITILHRSLFEDIYELRKINPHVVIIYLDVPYDDIIEFYDNSENSSELFAELQKDKDAYSMIKRYSDFIIPIDLYNLDMDAILYKLTILYWTSTLPQQKERIVSPWL